ncbi:MAG TPA: triose-phosphate isomerase [Acetobacteraceae bacterium]|nr:triose-phosphate isomerase [Acetobacteraceae bacterium]
MRQIIAGNWKMNGTLAGLAGYAAGLRHGMEGLDLSGTELILCPPFPLIRPLAEAVGDTAVAIGAQDCDAHRKGAHTGDVSADLLAEIGARYVILGHSERRTDHGESSSAVRDKVRAVMAAGMVPIVCVGETEAEREAHEAETVVRAQLAGSLPDDFAGIIAYEPVWAIGSGKIPGEEDVAQMHATIRGFLKRRFSASGGTMPILYGGSVKPENAAALLAIPEVGGALIGGASLRPEDFLAIAAAAKQG